MADKRIPMEVTLLALLDNKKYLTLRDVLDTMNPADIAAVFDELEAERIPLLFRLLPKETAAETFAEMEAEAQEILIRGFSDRELKEVIDEMYVDDMVDLIEEMPANVVKRVLAQADAETRKDINQILKYPEDSAGSWMTTEYVALHRHMTVEESIKRIRRTGIDKETIYTCYVIAHNRQLLGMVSVKDLLLAEDDEQTIGEIMEDNVISVATHDDQETVAQMFRKYNFLALPVVDNEGRMVGIVTFDDAMDVMEDETTEDMEKMTAILPSEKSYMRSSVVDIWKNRIPWLLFLMLSSTFTAMIITGFENALAAQVALTAFMPMIMGTSGNSGTQASVTVIRALSLDEVEFGDWFRVMWKEMRISVLTGVSLAVATFLKIYIVDIMLLGNHDITIMVALTISVSLIATVFLAKTVGGMLPLVAQKCGADPAVMASPLIATIVDALSLMVYFGVANLLLQL